MNPLFDHWSYPAAFEKALAAGADPNAPDKHGNLPLAYAARDKKPDYVALLIKAGANLDAISEHSRETALCGAISAKDWKSAMMLVEAGADPSVTGPGLATKLGHSPLNWAYANDNKVAVAIRERGPKYGPSEGEPFLLPIEIEKAMGKLVGGYKRAHPYDWVLRIREVQAQIRRLGGKQASAEALAKLDAGHILARLLACAFEPGTRFRARPGTTVATWLEDWPIELTEPQRTVAKLDRDLHAKSLKPPFTPFARVGKRIELVVYYKNPTELIRGWDFEEPSDDISYSLDGDATFLASIDRID